MAGIGDFHFAAGIGSTGNERRVLCRQSAFAKDAAGSLHHLIERQVYRNKCTEQGVQVGH